MLNMINVLEDYEIFLGIFEFLFVVKLDFNLDLVYYMYLYDNFV